MPIGIGLMGVGSLATVTYLDSREKWPRFTVSAETTVLTEPLTPEGFIDYAEAARRRIQDIRPEDNAARLLLEALGPEGLRDPSQWESACEQMGLSPLLREGDYLISVEEWLRPIAEEHGVEVNEIRWDFEDEISICTEIPWRADEHPEVAGWLAVNKSPLLKAIEASRHSDFREPVEAGGWFYGSLMERIQVFGRLLTLRAMQRLESDDLAGAWEDVLATYRLGRLASQGDSHYFIAGGFESLASGATSAILSSPLMTPAWLDRIERDWERLPKWRDYADYVDTAQRMQVLSFIQETSQRSAEGFAESWNLKSTTIPTDQWLLQIYLARVNWGQVMIDANRRVDDLRDAAAELDLVKRAQLLGWYDDVDHSLIRSCCELKIFADESIQSLVVRGSTCVEAYAAETTPRNIETQSQYIKIAIAVERHRFDHGSIPAMLYELVPDYLDEVPVDPYAPTQRVQYFPATSDGYVIHNAGWRRHDELEPPPDENRYSFRVRMSVAPWLLPDDPK